MKTEQQPNPTAFFLDRNHGLSIRDILRRVGMKVYNHTDFGWPNDKADVEIIHECAQKSIVIIGGDKSMERVPEERQAIIDTKCKVFMFSDSHKTKTEDWIASILVAREKIYFIAQRATGPLFVTINPCRAKGHIEQPRFAEGGRWLPDAEAIPIVMPPLEHLAGPSRRVSRQIEMFMQQHPAGS